jgi:thiol-disulfide isomerase/thioredoxin
MSLPLIAFLFVACTSGAGDPATRQTAESPPDSPDPMPRSTPTSGVEPGTSVPTVVLDQPWATATLTDVNTGGTFTIAELVADGKVVIIETMAIWCTNCRAQQREAVTAFEGSDPGDVAWVAIDIESSESAEALARYSADNGFPFMYVVADTDLARALVAEFGDIVLSPPSVNIIVIGRDGRVTHTRGHKSAEELRAIAADHGA